MCDVSHSNFIRMCGNEIHAGPRLRAHLQYTLLQHATVTRYCNTLLQHATATRYCTTLTAAHYCNTLLQHTYCNTLLHHTTALHKCNDTLPQQIATSYYLGPIASRIFAIPTTGTRHCNKLTATDLLQHTYCNTLLRHAYCTTRIQRHATATLCCVISLVPDPLALICNTHNCNTLLQQSYCNTFTATHYCTTLLHHNSAPHYCIMLTAPLECNDTLLQDTAATYY